ncbi:hypothetical protein SAMN05216374_5938 [Tardiphaga sp. OK246]|uniref:hypothetical protein n=1 Tax=Tardiphaga sp. OK246 TaxID=1855307 RepID=UPI000B6D1060|nr:hypothetical protein [Tardiphaga sp. OK246]SNT61610.1 hypothetical protein SAMN05216374_5938 [Tardiphaga sp. OK246]
MGAVQFENLLLILFPIIFGFLPAFLDAVGFKNGPPNLLTALVAALLVAISSLAWMPTNLDNLVIVFGLIMVPAMLIAYCLSRLAIWLLLSLVKMAVRR